MDVKDSLAAYLGQVLSPTLKRGTVVKNIRLTNSAAEIGGRVGSSTMVLKTEFLKKA